MILAVKSYPGFVIDLNAVCACRCDISREVDDAAGRCGIELVLAVLAAVAV
jgi:hypothetical protein